MTASAVLTPVLSPTNAMDVTLTGKFDADAALALRRQITEASEAGPVLVLVDVSGVTQVNPSGLASLIDILRYARTRGGDVRLYGVSPVFDRAHSAMQLESVTRLYPSHPEAARGDFQSPTSHRYHRDVTRRRAGLRGHFGRRPGIVRSS